VCENWVELARKARCVGGNGGLRKLFWARDMSVWFSSGTIATKERGVLVLASIESSTIATRKDS